MITNINNDGLGIWGNAFGQVDIDCIKYPQTMYKWLFKLNTTEVTIGIIDKIYIDKSCENNKYCFSIFPKNDYGDKTFYALGNGGHLESHNIDISQAMMTSINNRYGIYTKFGDILSMIFDTKRRTLRYLHNEKDLGIAFNDIDVTKIYRMAVSVYLQSSSVQLMDFRFGSF